MKLKAKLARWPFALLVGAVGAALAADPITFSDVPLFIVSPVKPNLMVILDNSQSMDATMAGKLIAGDDDLTRGNIARRVLRNVITTNRNKFNWGLTAFESTNTPVPQDTHAYYMGDQDSMVFTADCDLALSPAFNPSGKRKGCVEIPGTPIGALNKKYVTYAQSGDDPAINDVFYTDPGTAPAVMYGDGTGGAFYKIWGARDATQDWPNANFAAPPFNGDPGPYFFSPTDAGFVPSAGNTPPVTRQVWIRRPNTWGYAGPIANNGQNPITGRGEIREPVQTESQAHFDRLTALLQNEKKLPNTEIKNGAVYTPLEGSLKTVREYFDGSNTPITQTCQKNYVVLATDGVPTGKTDGSQWELDKRTNTKLVNGTWDFGDAQKGVFGEIQALRLGGNAGVRLAGQDYDVRTFVIGMGESVVNESSLAALDRMADLGGGSPSAFIGDNEANLATAFASIVNSIDTVNRGSASVAVNSGAYRAGSAIYQAKFLSGNWSGAVLAYGTDAAGVIATTPSWDAGALLKARTAERNIFTYKPSGAFGSRGIPFRWPADAANPGATELDAAQAAAIDKNAAGNTDGNGAPRLAYLRGVASNEKRNCAACALQFRDRVDGPLGDIVNSAPNFVAAPSFGYANDFEAASYGAFTSTYKNRKKVIYVGANDGMLHAFDADNGAELLAYVPAAVYGSLSQLSSLTYAHRYSVDGSPTVGDVFYGGAWHTLLAAGMRAGAKGLFALDVTNPGLFNDEANAPGIARWEFQDSADMGYVFGQPLLVKTNTGKWAVIVGGGYGNTSGNAVLFVIDAQNGNLIRKLNTGSGTNNGLSAPAAIDTNGDGVVDLVYAGDLNGNMWKFDLRSTDESLWTVGNAGAALFTAGATKPITAAPDVTRFPRGGYLVGFGTGRYFDETDNGNSDPQSLYAIWDDLSNGTVGLTDLQQQTVVDTTTSNGVDFRLSTHAVGSPADTFLTSVNPARRDNQIARADYFSLKRGWYLNLPTTKERAVADVAFRNGRFIVVTIIPATGCTQAETGGSGWLMEFDAITGNRLDVVTFDINRDNKLTAALLNGDYLPFTVSGASGNNVSGQRIDGIPSGQTTVTKGSLTEDRLFSTSKGTLEQIGTGRGVGRDGRAMWREVR